MALERATGFGQGFPVPFSSLVGREQEIRSILDLLRRPHLSILTLTGPAGTGKTRLALKVAADAESDFADGTVFVSLASITDPALVLPTIAQALGVWDSNVASLPGLLIELLAEKSVLLVLDNFEQIVAAAPVLPPLLSACPGLKILVTSRVVLRITGEQEFPVPPMQLPEKRTDRSFEEIAANESVALFLQRARAINPGFTLTESNASAIVDLCRRLDGLPLAIELAAARVKVLSPQALLARLTNRLQVLTGGARDVPLRLQTMRDAIAWSYDLLDERERMLFRRLSVFVGGFTLEAAEAVAGRLTDDSTALDGIGSLVDNSLVRQDEGLAGEPRFAMLETIREYGLEQLLAAGEESAIRDAHATWFIELAEGALPERSDGVRHNSSLSLLELEHDNFRSALSWLYTSVQADRLVQLAGSLGWFWHLRGHVTEGRSWLESALARATIGKVSSTEHARALRAAGQLAWEQADFQLATGYIEAARALSAEIGDHFGTAQALINLGVIQEKQGDDAAAMVYFEEGLALYRVIDHQVGIAHAVINMGDASFRQGDLERSAELTAEALALSRKVSDPLFTALALANAGQLALAEGRAEEATVHFQESLSLSAETNNLWFVANALGGLAGAVTASGDAALGARWLGCARAACEALGTPSVPHHEQFARSLAATRGALPAPAFDAAWDAGRALSIDQVVAEGLGWRWCAAGSAPPVVAPASTSTAAKYNLTDRERDVLRLILDGKSSREIADELYISPRTATTHISNILSKLGVNSRSAAVALAFQQKLV